MFWLIQQMLIALLLSFSISFSTKSVSLNNEPCMTRSTIVDLNSVELDYYILLISLDKCNGSY